MLISVDWMDESVLSELDESDEASLVPHAASGRTNAIAAMAVSHTSRLCEHAAFSLLCLLQTAIVNIRVKLFCYSEHSNSPLFVISADKTHERP